MCGWSARTCPAMNPTARVRMRTRVDRRFRRFKTSPFSPGSDMLRQPRPRGADKHSRRSNSMHRMRFLLPLAATVALPLTAADTVTPPPAVSRAVRTFSADAIAAHDKFLASDLLEGRGPGTRGDQLAMEY